MVGTSGTKATPLGRSVSSVHSETASPPEEHFGVSRECERDTSSSFGRLKGACCFTGL